MLSNRIAVKIAFFINGFIYANWISRLPRITEIYGMNKGTLGVVLLASSLGAVVTMPFTGWAIIKNGSRAITLFSAFMYCAIVLAIPFMPNISLLMVLYFIMGVITGMLDVAMNSQAVMVEKDYGKPIMTSFHAFFSIGMALGAWCGALFVDLNYDLFLHLIIVVSASLLATLWLSRNLVQDRPDKSLKNDGPLFRLPTAALVSVGVIAFCCMFGEGAMADWTVLYMRDIVRSEDQIAPIALSAFATAMTVGRIFGDRVRLAYGDRKLIIAGGIISTVGLLAALAFPIAYVAIGGFFLVGLGLATIVPITYSIAGNTKDQPSGVGLAMVTTVGYSGFLFGPPIIGFLADWKNLQFSLALVAVLFVTMTILGYRYKTKP